MVDRKMPTLAQKRSVETRDALIEGAATVFARLSYGEARLRDIAGDSGISEGSIYFHFGTKAEIAGAVIAAQQERMTAVLAGVRGSAKAPRAGLEQLLLLLTRLAKLISKDPVVQGGIRLAGEPSPELSNNVSEPYFEWVRIVSSLVRQGIADGSIRADVDVERVSETINYLFVGAQVLSGLADSWKSFPVRLKRVIPTVEALLQH
ncbi:TetR/AcrR family transcriptional regulator [Microbacterium protaetiae]|nr:TetR/AcrR family transcriptional regulator [Microbacterium protaetiae]